LSCGDDSMISYCLLFWFFVGKELEARSWKLEGFLAGSFFSSKLEARRIFSWKSERSGDPEIEAFCGRKRS